MQRVYDAGACDYITRPPGNLASCIARRDACHYQPGSCAPDSGRNQFCAFTGTPRDSLSDFAAR